MKNNYIYALEKACAHKLTKKTSPCKFVHKNVTIFKKNIFVNLTRCTSRRSSTSFSHTVLFQSY